MKLLIADDEPLIRQGLRTIHWESIGVTLCGIVENGLEAFELAQKEKPDIVLTDIRMPGMDGITLSRKLCSENPRCIIIFLSGYSDFEYARQAIQLNAYDYILKPTSPDEILDCVKRAVHSGSRRREPFLLRQEKAAEKDSGAGGFSDSGRSSGIQVQEILNFLKLHYQENISLSDVSSKFHFNSIYINRVLKKETGSTFLVLLNDIRLQHAMELLGETDLKISVVAEMCGFSDQRYFSQIFRKNTGYTPAQFRKLHCRQNGEDSP